jgi:Tfp pilus assembly protein PilF
MKSFLFSIISLVFYTCVPFFVTAQTVDDALLLDYYQGQRYLEASAYLKRIYQEPVTNAVALRNLAYASQMAGKLVEAEGYYHRLYSMDSTKLSVINSLAGINLRRGNLNKADYFYKRILAADSTNFFVLNQLAQLSYQKADITSYIIYLIKANKINPEDADVAADLSNQYVALKQFSIAETVLSRAIAADPENVVLLQSLIKLTHAEKKWPETVKVGIQLLALGDVTFSTALKLGQGYYNLKNYTCCLETLAALQDEQQNETSYYYMAMSYKGLKQYTNSTRNFELAIDKGISNSIATYYGEMAGGLQEAKQLKKQRRLTKKA